MKSGPVKHKKAQKSSLYDQDSVIYAKSHLMFTDYNLAKFQIIKFGWCYMLILYTFYKKASTHNLVVIIITTTIFKIFVIIILNSRKHGTCPLKKVTLTW